MLIYFMPINGISSFWFGECMHKDTEQEVQDAQEGSPDSIEPVAKASPAQVLGQLKRFIIERLYPLRYLNPTCFEVVDDSVVHLGATRYVSRSDDPKLIIPSPFRRGLYLFRWTGRADARILVKLYPTVNHFSSEAVSSRLGYLEETRTFKERFVLFKGDADSMRLDPGEKTGVTFEIDGLSYKRLSTFSAVRVGIGILSRSSGTPRLTILFRMVKWVLTGKKSQAKQCFSNAFNTFGEGEIIASGDEEGYQRYIRNWEPSADELETQRVESDSWSSRPLISIVVPVYNTDRSMLVEMIESVRLQTYSNWQLCLADGSSSKSEVRDILSRYEKNDSRIKCLFLHENRGIVGNSNAALKMADGEYTALLDHDDLLSRWALYEVARVINENPMTDMIYSDEDKITADGASRFQAHFKPDWSPDLLRSYNYITHLFVARTALINELGGFRAGYDGSQDHDLILRVSEKAQFIRHISSVLYHWRSHEASTALNPQSKTYTLAAGAKAIDNHLKRIGLSGKTSYDAVIGTYKVEYDIPGEPLVSIIIPNYEQKDVLEKCIDSIRNQSTYHNYEIIIIENNSRSKAIFDYYKTLESDPKIKVLTWSGAFNYSAINNFGATHASGDYLLLLNNDTEVIATDWVEQMLQFAVREDVGCVGAKLLYTDGTIQHAGVVLGFRGIAAHSFSRQPGDFPGYMNRAIVAQNVSAVTAACLMVKKSLFDAVGGLDESFVVAYNDIDFCLKIRALGKFNVYNPGALLYHHESLSRGYEDTPEKLVRFEAEVAHFRSKWETVLADGDPFYHSHLDREISPFRISGD